ncbi:hypothetical protein ACIQXZ_12295 [Bacillus thuringiensis]|uniref:hypothetical protein n=1 Tax=Bacillus thuringiensis TaxID=1428 RepID=UPI00382D5B4E
MDSYSVTGTSIFIHQDKNVTKILFYRNKETKKEHHASVLFKIGGNTLSWIVRLKVYDVEKE